MQVLFYVLPKHNLNPGTTSRAYIETLLPSLTRSSKLMNNNIILNSNLAPYSYPRLFLEPGDNLRMGFMAIVNL